jgi:hypothetical protein
MGPRSFQRLVSWNSFLVILGQIDRFTKVGVAQPMCAILYRQGSHVKVLFFIHHTVALRILGRRG